MVIYLSWYKAPQTWLFKGFFVGVYVHVLFFIFHIEHNFLFLITVDESSCSMQIAHDALRTSSSEVVTNPPPASPKPARKYPQPLSTEKGATLLVEYFPEAMQQHHLHSFYNCCQKCTDLPTSEKDHMRSQKNRPAKNEVRKSSDNNFKHTWLTDKAIAFSKDTGRPTFQGQNRRPKTKFCHI